MTSVIAEPPLAKWEIPHGSDSPVQLHATSLEGIFGTRAKREMTDSEPRSVVHSTARLAGQAQDLLLELAAIHPLLLGSSIGPGEDGGLLRTTA